MSTIYLLLTLPEVIMVNLNHKPSKSVDVEIIGQCGIQIELNSWVKYEIFGHVVYTPKGVACLNTSGYLYENWMKLWGTKYDLCNKVSCKNLV